MAVFESILYLDDMRVPTLHGVHLVRTYAEFAQYLDERGMPDLISFDHDLAEEHYPVGPNEAGRTIPYADYVEKTGFDCARFIIDNNLDLRHWAVHSCNVQGRLNIERELRQYCRRGEVRDLRIPFQMREADDVTAPPVRSFSATSLLQFEDDVPLESWEIGLSDSFAKRQ